MKPNRRPAISTYAFLACGVWLVGLGIYFMLVRPPLLPEDTRYIGTSLGHLRAAAPGLEAWLHRVFIVAGGFIAGAGVLWIFVSLEGSHSRRLRRWNALALAGLLTLVVMTAVNFDLDSDFKTLLLGPTVLWVVALVLNAAEAARRQ